MKSRKGFALPLVIVLVAFMMLLGALAINVANSTHKISYGNIKKNQSFYLAKAGLEIGYGFLDSPIDPSLSPGTGETWFNRTSPQYTLATISQVHTDFVARTSQVQSISVFVDPTVPNASPVFVTGGGSAPAGHIHVGDIQLQIELRPAVNGSPLVKDQAIFRITSTATLASTISSINDTHRMTMDVRATNKFDRKVY